MSDGHLDDGAVLLASKLALLDQCRRAETRATMFQVASLIAHMIGTPLNVIVGRAALARSNSNPERIQDHVRRIEEQTQRLTLRIQRLVEYLDLPEPDAEPRRVADVIADAVALYDPVARHNGCAVELVNDHLPDSHVDGTRTLAVLTALISLAIRCSGAEKLVELDAKGAPREGGVVVTLHVPGMEATEERFDRLEPLERLDPKHAEQAQMLAICAASAKGIGGALDMVADEERGGVKLCLHLEAHPAASPG